MQRWPETKRLLGLLVNSSGAAHARNARRLVHAARKQDRRLSAALLAAAIAHSPEGEEILRGARTRLARKPSALSRELLRNFPKARGRRGSRRRRKKGAGESGGDGAVAADGGRRTARADEVVGQARASTAAAAARQRALAAPFAPLAQRPRAQRRPRSRPVRETPSDGDAGSDRQRRGGDSDASRSPRAGARARARHARRARAARRPSRPVDDAAAVSAIADAAAALAAARGPKPETPPAEPEAKPKPSRRRSPAKPGVAVATAGPRRGGAAGDSAGRGQDDGGSPCPGQTGHGRQAQAFPRGRCRARGQRCAAGSQAEGAPPSFCRGYEGCAGRAGDVAGRGEARWCSAG